MTLAKRGRAIALVAIAFLVLLDAACVVVTARRNPAHWAEGPRGVLLSTTRLRSSGDGYTGSIDGLWIGTTRYAPDARGIITIPRGGAPELRGWAIDAKHRLPFAAAFLSVDGRPAQPVPYGATRPDVARVMRCACTASGIDLGFEARELAPGSNRIRLTFVTPDRRTVVAGPAIEVRVR